MGVTYCKKAHNFQMDSHTCTTFTAKVNHEPKVNCLTGKKGGVAVRVACNKKARNF